MRASIYSRVSSENQNTDNQTQHLVGWAAQRGYEVVKIYCEKESAWKAGQQAELSQMVLDAYKRKFDIVLVWSLDRLSREGALAILTLVNKLQRVGVKVISYQESWTEAPGELGELLFALTGWVARMESQRRSERTKAGIERARKEAGPNVRKAGQWGRRKGKRDSKQRKRHKKGALAFRREPLSLMAC